MKNKRPKQLSWYQFLLLKTANLFASAWTRTLRFQLDSETKALITNEKRSLVVILWHNRLFVVPEFYRRYARKRKLAAIVSTSSAGAWLSGLFKTIDVKPIRGSRNGRGVQAFREMLKANEEGYDVGVTPDGSRGPMYEMKPGAVKLALRANTPIALLSYNFKKAFRLESWDRFYIPWPFSLVEVKIEFIEVSQQIFSEDVEQARSQIKARLDGITKDIDDDYLRCLIV